MAIYCAGTSIADVFDPAQWAVSTTGANLAPHVSEGIAASSTVALGELRFNQATGDFWFAFSFALANTTSPRDNFVSIRNGVTDLFRFTGTSNGFVALRYWNGTTWVTVGTPFAVSSTTVYRVDIRIKMHETEGELEWFINGTSHGTFSGDTIYTANTAVDNVLLQTFRTTAAATSTTLSGWMATSFSTLGVEPIQRLATGNGALTAWTGAFGDVGGTGVNDATYASTDTAGVRESYTKPNLSAFSGWQVLGVVHAMRGRVGVGAEGEVSPFVRYGGVNYDAPAVPFLPSFSPAMSYMEYLPTTSTRFTMADLSTSEFGILSVAA